MTLRIIRPRMAMVTQTMINPITVPTTIQAICVSPKLVTESALAALLVKEEQETLVFVEQEESISRA